MWPWAEQPHIRTLLQHTKGRRWPPWKSGGGGGGVGVDSDDASRRRGFRGLRPLTLLAPGGGRSSDDIRDGSYQLSASFVVDGDLLEAAVEGVLWLVVVFEPRQEGGEEGREEEEEEETDCPFPSWVLRLRNLRGLSLVRYPHPTLPEEIGDLTTLEHLHCYRSALVRVPRSIGRLENLVELDMYTSYGLHYLPYEVTRCPRLTKSRFSTRALYANPKNDLPLPPLPRSAWDHSGEARPSSPRCCGRDELRDLLLRRLDFGIGGGGEAPPPLLLPADLVDGRILPLLGWNRCSVCDGLYQDDYGRPVWSRRRVATDGQSLLAFCCSAACEEAVPGRMAFDPVGGRNVTVETIGRLPDAEDEQPTEAAWAVARDAAQKISGRAPERYEEWAKEHLVLATETEQGT